MNIGVFFKHEKSGGGIYQYFLTVMECLKRITGKGDHFFLFYCHDPGCGCLTDFQEAGITTVKLEAHTQEIEAGSDFSAIHEGKTVYFKTRPYSTVLSIEAKSHNIDLMLYTNVERESFESGIPYLTALLDWTHRTHPEFAEFAADGVYEQREYVITNSIKDAICIIADSQAGKEEIVEFYNVTPKKVKVLPFVPPPYFFHPLRSEIFNRIKLEFDLPERFIFYPAQFWPHKNHENIIKAIALLKKRNRLEISVVFTGSTQNKWSSYDRTMGLAKDLAVQDQIIYLGYIDSDRIKALYKLAAALVMPTFPGPTNIPVLEAFAMECPIITSDIKALREQVGDAGILVNPYSPNDIAAAILKIWQDKALVRELTDRGKKKLAAWGPQEFFFSLRRIIGISKQSITDPSVDTA